VDKAGLPQKRVNLRDIAAEKIGLRHEFMNKSVYVEFWRKLVYSFFLLIKPIHYNLQAALSRYKMCG